MFKAYYLEQKLTDCIVSDIDGTLVSVSGRFKMALSSIGIDSSKWGKLNWRQIVKLLDTLSDEQKEQFDKIFNSDKFTDMDYTINPVIKYIKKLQNETNLPVVLVSGRTSDTLNGNIRAVDQIAGQIRIIDIFFWNRRTSSIEDLPQWKVNIIKNHYYNPLYVLDDDPKIISAFQSEFPNAKYILIVEGDIKVLTKEEVCIK